MLKVTLNRLKPQADKEINEEKANFRAGKEHIRTDLKSKSQNRLFEVIFILANS